MSLCSVPHALAQNDHYEVASPVSVAALIRRHRVQAHLSFSCSWACAPRR